MSQAEISMDLRWRQNETIERRQGSGRPSTSTAEDDNMLLNRLRNSPFMTAVEAVNTSKYRVNINYCSIVGGCALCFRCAATPTSCDKHL
jgi:hypothetical protein